MSSPAAVAADDSKVRRVGPASIDQCPRRGMQVIKAVLLVCAATVRVPAIAVFATPAEIGPGVDPAPLEPSEHRTDERRLLRKPLVAVRAQNRWAFSIAARTPERHHRDRHTHTTSGEGIQPPSV